MLGHNYASPQRAYSGLQGAFSIVESLCPSLTERRVSEKI